jgi:hypothetical protein
MESRNWIRLYIVKTFYEKIQGTVQLEKQIIRKGTSDIIFPVHKNSKRVRLFGPTHCQDK